MGLLTEKIFRCVGEIILLLSASIIGTGWWVAVLQEYDILV